MQSIENLTRLYGQIVECQPHPQREGYELLTMRVEETKPVAGKADLLSQHCGQDLDVAVRQELLQGAATTEGAYVELRAKMTPDGPLAEPHPDAGNFTLTAPPQRP